MSDQSFCSVYFVLKEYSFQQQDLQAMMHDSNSSRLCLAHNAGLPAYLLSFDLFYSIVLAAGDV